MASVKNENTKNPAIFSIQHFCLHDGPGVRSIVFFKGCPLRCAWCQNPESWRASPEAAFKAHLCIDCNTCVGVCPQKAITVPGIRDPSKCDGCFTCVENCPSGAMACFGKYYSINELMDVLRPEFPYMKNTGGGVTFSGGEPTLIPEFIAGLSSRLHEEEVHVTIETCGYFDPNMDTTFLSDVDLVFFDIKLYDDASHRKFCGTTNHAIKKNLARLSAQSSAGTGPAVWPRLPVIPTVSDTSENLTAWAHFLNEIGIPFLTLVPYHNLGASKRQWMCLPPASSFSAIADERMEEVVQIFGERGIACYAPGKEDWGRAGIS